MVMGPLGPLSVVDMRVVFLKTNKSGMYMVKMNDGQMLFLRDSSINLNCSISQRPRRVNDRWWPLI